MASIWIGFLLLQAAVAGLDDGYGRGPEYGAAPSPRPPSASGEQSGNQQAPLASGEKSGNQQASALHRPAVVSSDSGKKSGHSEGPSAQPAPGLATKPDLKATPMAPVQQARMAPLQSPSATGAASTTIDPSSKAIFGAGRQQPAASGKPKGFNPKKIVGPVIGGIAGAATLAGVIAISAMKKPGNWTEPVGATQPVETVEGSITLQVLDAKSFASDMVAQKAVAAGIADAAGVKPEYVVLTANSIRRLQAIMTPQLVQLKYKIVIPRTDTTQSAAVVDKQLAAQSASDIAKTVQGRLRAAKGPSYSVAVTQYSVDKHPAVTLLPTPAHSTQAPKPAVRQPPATHPPVAQTTKPAKQKLKNPFEMIKAAFAKAKPLNGQKAPAKAKVTPPEVKSTLSQKKPALKAKKAAPAQTSTPFQVLPQVVFTTTTFETTTTTVAPTLAPNLGAAPLAPLAMTTSTSIVAPPAGSSDSGSSSSSGFHNSFMAGGISIAWIMVACGVAGFFLFRKKKRPKKKPSQETFMPDERDYGRDYGNNTYDEQPLMKEQTALSAPDMESQYLPQESQYMQVQPHYAGHQNAAQPNLPAPPPAYAEFQPGLPAPPPAPVPQAARGLQQSPLAVSHVPQLPQASDYTPQLSLPMNGLIGMNLPPTMYG